MDIEVKDYDLDNVIRYLKNDIEECEVYESVRHLCYLNRHQELIEIIKNHYAQYLDKLETLMKVEEDTQLFEMATQMWIKFKESLLQIKEVLKYLDIKQSLEDLIINQLVSLIDNNIEARLQRVILGEIAFYRKEPSGKLPLQLSDLIQKLKNFSYFENQYLTETHEFYKYIIVGDKLTQIKNANITYELETSLYACFPKEFQNRIMDVLNEQVFRQINISDLDNLYFNIDAMKQVYKLSVGTNNLSKLKQGLRKYIYKEAVKILNNGPHEVIHFILLLEEKCDQMIQQVFEDQEITNLKRHAIEDAVYEQIQRFSYSLCYVLDQCDQNYLQKCLQAIKFISDKESFKLYYMKFLIKRLIKGSKLSQEQKLLEQLLNSCGQDWVDGINELLVTQEQSINTTQKFLNHYVKKKIAVPKFDVVFHLISLSYWPYQIDSELDICAPLKKVGHQFIKFKAAEPESMNITLQEQLSVVTFRVKINNPFDLKVPQKYASELLKFNDKKPVIHFELFNQFNGLIIQQDGQYKVNLAYRSKSNTEIIEEEIQTLNETNAKQSDYLYVIDAAIVKIIKQQKSMLIMNLVEETINLIKKQYPKFIDLADEELIVKQISELITKEFIYKRDNKIEYL